MHNAVLGNHLNISFNYAPQGWGFFLFTKFGWGGVDSRFSSSVIPPYQEWPRDWQNMFAISRFRYIRVLFHIYLLLLERQISFVIPSTLLYLHLVAKNTNYSANYSAISPLALRFRFVISIIGVYRQKCLRLDKAFNLIPGFVIVFVFYSGTSKFNVWVSGSSDLDVLTL